MAGLDACSPSSSSVHWNLRRLWEPTWKVLGSLASKAIGEAHGGGAGTAVRGIWWTPLEAELGAGAAAAAEGVEGCAPLVLMSFSYEALRTDANLLALTFACWTVSAAT